MAQLTGLFERGGAYYLRVVLPLNHPLLDRYKSGKVVSSLGRCSHREALRLGTIKRAEILWGVPLHPLPTDIPTDIGQHRQAITHARKPVHLRDVYELWVKSSRRTADSIAACNRALKLFEQHTNNPVLSDVSRSLGNEFRSVLQTLAVARREWRVSETYAHDTVNLYSITRCLEIRTHEYECKGVAVALILCCSYVAKS